LKGYAGEAAGLSVFPEFVETVGGKLSVEHGVLDVPVPEIVLDGAGILTIIGEFEAGGMSEHVRMDRHAELGSSPARATSLRNVAAVIGARRSEMKTYADSG